MTFTIEYFEESFIIWRNNNLMGFLHSPELFAETTAPSTSLSFPLNISIIICSTSYLGCSQQKAYLVWRKPSTGESKRPQNKVKLMCRHQGTTASSRLTATIAAKQVEPSNIVCLVNFKWSILNSL
jgi:hypothetical protein